MSKRNTEARDRFFTEHLDAGRVKEVFDLAHRDFCKLFYNNSQYSALRSMGERFEELALREKGGYLASYYLISLQDLICSHIIANIGEELFNNHNFEVKVSKSCVQLTTECKEYLIHGLMGNPEASTWIGKDNAPIEAIHNNEWKAVVFDLMNNAITAGPSFFIANQLIFDNIQAFEVHVKDTRQNHLEKKYFEKILAKRTEVDDEDAFSFSSNQNTDNGNHASVHITESTQHAKVQSSVNQQNEEVKPNPTRDFTSAKPNYHKNYPKYRKDYQVNTETSVGLVNEKDGNQKVDLVNQDNKVETTKTYPNTHSSNSKPYYKKPYYKKNDYKNNQINNTDTVVANGQGGQNNESSVPTNSTKMKM